MSCPRRLFSTCLLVGLAAAPAAWAAQVSVAVAANFTEPAKQIAAVFKEKTGHDVVLSFGSSGQLQTQISQSAPFQVFLSADDVRPKALVANGFGVPGSVFTYAIGKLVLWSRQPGLVDGERTLDFGKFAKIAIANPQAAPYGAAAIETMKALRVYDTLRPKIVEGATISQAFQFTQTGNAELGFVALSQVIKDNSGSRWMVPQTLYTPIRQDAVLLKTGEASDAAKAFVAFLKGPDAQRVIESYGYGTAPAP